MNTQIHGSEKNGPGKHEVLRRKFVLVATSLTKMPSPDLFLYLFP